MQVGNNGHGLQGRGVSVGPPRQLVEVAPDPGQLAGALTLEVRPASRPGPDVAEGTPDELGEGDTGGRGCGLPRGPLGRRAADLHPGRAALGMRHGGLRAARTIPRRGV